LLFYFNITELFHQSGNTSSYLRVTLKPGCHYSNPCKGLWGLCLVHSES